jgi:hypothetical protein
MRKATVWRKVCGLLGALAAAAVVVGVFRVCEARSLAARESGANDAEREEADFEASVARLQHRREAKNVTLHELLDHRIGLLEAAHQFYLANETDPSTRGVVRLFCEDDSLTDEELYCRHVIERVGVELADHPAEAKAETARLQAELRHDHEAGPLHFPE